MWEWSIVNSNTNFFVWKSYILIVTRGELIQHIFFSSGAWKGLCQLRYNGKKSWKFWKLAAKFDGNFQLKWNSKRHVMDAQPCVHKDFYHGSFLRFRQNLSTLCYNVYYLSFLGRDALPGYNPSSILTVCQEGQTIRNSLTSIGFFQVFFSTCYTDTLLRCV